MGTYRERKAFMHIIVEEINRYFFLKWKNKSILFPIRRDTSLSSLFIQSFNHSHLSVYWCRPVIPGAGSEDQFRASLNYIASLKLAWVI